jgi:hypothetical protein
MLTHQGEPTLRSLAEMCTRRAEELEREAAIERERARQYLEAADARAAEKRTRKEARRARQQPRALFAQGALSKK